MNDCLNFFFTVLKQKYIYVCVCVYYIIFFVWNTFFQALDRRLNDIQVAPEKCEPWVYILGYS